MRPPSGTAGRLLLTVVTVLAEEVLGAVGIVLVVSGRDGICVQKNILVAAFLPSKRLPSPTAQSLGINNPGTRHAESPRPCLAKTVLMAYSVSPWSQLVYVTILGVFCFRTI